MNSSADENKILIIEDDEHILSANRQLLELAGRFPLWLTAEENVLEGGFGGAVLECLSDAGVLPSLTVRRLGLPDAFVEHGPQRALRALCGIDIPGIEKALRRLLGL